MAERNIVSTGRAFFLIVPLVVMACGCSGMNLFNPSFLDQFQPFGITSVDTIEGKGPVTIVIENLTEEACHGEYASLTIRYIDESGAERSYPVNYLPAVARANREPTSADYDDSFRKIIILSCGIRAVWLEGQVYRRSIMTRSENRVWWNFTNDDGTNRKEEITLPDGTIQTLQVGEFIGDIGDDVSPTQVCHIEQAGGAQEAVTAVMVPAGQLLEPTNFQCGDVILFGILDHVRSDGSIVPPNYGCEVTFFTQNDFLCRRTPTGVPQPRIDPSTGLEITNPDEDLYYEDPTHVLLNSFYEYPDSYLIVPMVVPDLAQVASATLALYEQAKQLGSLVD